MMIICVMSYLDFSLPYPHSFIFLIETTFNYFGILNNQNKWISWLLTWSDVTQKWICNNSVYAFCKLIQYSIINENSESSFHLFFINIKIQFAKKMKNHSFNNFMRPKFFFGFTSIKIISLIGCYVCNTTILWKHFD